MSFFNFKDSIYLYPELIKVLLQYCQQLKGENKMAVLVSTRSKFYFKFCLLHVFSPFLVVYIDFSE